MTVEGRPAVKLSDNPRKATGPDDEIARYRRVFNSPNPTRSPRLAMVEAIVF